MLRWLLIFFVVATSAAVFSGIAGADTNIARTLFFVFLVLFIASATARVLHTDGPK